MYKLPIMEKIDSNEANDKIKPKIIVENEVIPKIRRNKRKRGTSESCSDNEHHKEIVLSENTQQVENSNDTSVNKSNLDDSNVKHISKKIATNDHVLAVVKIKKKEESPNKVIKCVQPKLTRSKVKELMLISPKSAPVDFFNMDLTPIKHIPVKTRPEVKALIAQELPEDEDDEEYRPTHESDDDHDHTLESCSEPGTPHGPAASPAPTVTTDGSFKMPQHVSGAAPPPPSQSADDEATIARRTRSKLCLSQTPIEHIESSFVPPDEPPLPAPDVDWLDFLARCRDPAPAAPRPEDDDDADPEYNAAADPDAHEDEEDLLEMFPQSISKKEVNDLITELCYVMTDAQNYQTNDWVSNIAQEPGEVVSVNAGQWQGKVEPQPNNGEAEHQEATFNYQECNGCRISTGKTEPGESGGEGEGGGGTGVSQSFATNVRIEIEKLSESHREQDVWTASQAQSTLPPVEEGAEAEAEAGAEAGAGADDAAAAEPPPPVRRLHAQRGSTRTGPFADTDHVAELLPEQRLILQQQLRQHVQLAASNYLQLCVHPVFYDKAPVYKGFLDELHSMTESNPRSVAGVCNLRPACELAATWQRTVSSDTPENTKMVQFVQEQFDRNRRRAAQCCLYVGEFPETLQQVIANSPVFLYPSLLPPLPYRGENTRRNSYLRSEDELLALYLDEDWQYVEANPSLYPRPKRPPSRPGAAPRARWGMRATMELVCKRVPRWITPKTLHAHIRNVRRMGDRTNPIYRFLQNREITPVKHKLLPFNPEMTLYEQPEHEVPKIWLRYLAKTSKRFRDYLYRRSRVGPEPEGVPVDFSTPIEQPKRNPLPIDFTSHVPSHEAALLAKPNLVNRIDLHIATPVGEASESAAEQSVLVANNVYSVVETESGSYLVPVCVQTSKTGDKVSNPTENLTEELPSKTCADAENTGAVAEFDSQPPKPPDGNGIVTKKAPERCKCFALLRKIGIKDAQKPTYPRVSDKLRTLVGLYKSQPRCALEQLKGELKQLSKRGRKGVREDAGRTGGEAADVDVNVLAFAISYQTRLSIATDIAKNKYMKKRLHNIFSRFKPDEDSPLQLAEQLFQVFHVELIDMYKEFMGFLTAEQADKLGGFTDYFNSNCLQGLMRKVEECIPGRRERHAVLSTLHRLLCGNASTACQICSGVLAAVRRRPQLARHVFQLFPHTGYQDVDEVIVKQESEESDDACESERGVREPAGARCPSPEAPAFAERSPQLDTSDENGSMHALQIRNNTTNTESGPSEETTVIKQECVEETQPNDAENVRNDWRPGTESNEESMTVVSERESVDTTVDLPQTITNEITAVNQEQSSIAETQPIIENHKNERQHSVESSEESMIVVSEGHHVKTEAPTWKRDEDKLILEMIKETTLTYEHDKTLLELMEEQNQIQSISDSLVDKSQQDVRARVLFLIQKITRIGAPT